jgi:hypothetical protein
LYTMLAVAAYVGWSTIENERRTGQYPDIPWIVGYGLAIASAAWAILWFGYVRKTGRRVAGRYWLALMATSLATGLVAKAYLDYQYQLLAGGLTSVLEKYHSGKTNIDPQSLAAGGAGKIEATLRSIAGTFAGDAESYERELNATGFANLLSAANLKSDPDLSKPKYIIQQAQTVVRKYRQISIDRIASMPSLIDHSDLPNAIKVEVIEGMNESLPQATRSTERAWKLQADTMDEYAAIIQLLARSRGSWQVAGDQVSFDRQADLDAYQAHIAKIQAMGNEIDSIRSAGVTSSLSNLSKLK